MPEVPGQGYKEVFRIGRGTLTAIPRVWTPQNGGHVAPVLSFLTAALRARRRHRAPPLPGRAERRGATARRRLEPSDGAVSWIKVKRMSLCALGHVAMRQCLQAQASIISRTEASRALRSAPR